MNGGMIKRLILKDWYFGRGFVVAVIAAGLLMLLARFVFSEFFSPVAQVVAAVLFFGALNALMWLPMTTITAERTEQNLTFVMSLPITIRDYTAAKIAANLALFMVPWAVLTLATISYTLANDALPDSYAPVTLTLLVELLTLFCVMLGVALVSESNFITTTVGIVCNILFWFSFAFIGVIPGMGVVGDPTVVWESAARWMLIGELVAVPVLLAATFALQARKRDFI